MSFLDDEILRQIRVNRFQNGEILKVLKMLDECNTYIKAELRKSQGVSTKARYREISKQLTDLSRQLRSNVDELLNNPDFIDNEIESQRKILEKSGIKDIVIPNANTIRTASQFTPFAESANYEQMLNNIQSGFYNTWDNALRSGYMTGETTPKIISSVMGKVAKTANVTQYGTMQTLYNSIERNTRTYLQSLATITRERIFKENEKYFKGYRWVSTLDSRSCIVCGKLDSEVHESLSDFPQPPMHYNCRCVIVPITEVDFGSTRASADGYVDVDTDFNTWLQSQPDRVQLEVLGKTRYEMYQKDHNLTQFVADNQILTIKDLQGL